MSVNLYPNIKTKTTIAICIFLITLAFSSYSILNKNQFGRLEGMSEEYFQVAYSYYTTGKPFYQDKIKYQIFRPPGYIFFMVGVFKICNVTPYEHLTVRNEEARLAYHNHLRKLVSLAQCLLLSLSAVILFFWILKFANLPNAFIYALLFSCNPYSIILTGLTHYSTLHTFAVILAGYVLVQSITAIRYQKLKITLAGLLWGLTTLIRPMTLILPAFVVPLILFLKSRTIKSRFILCLIFCLSMFLTIAPYTFRNYKLTNQFVPISAQGKCALWSATVKHSKPSPNHYNWWDFYPDKGMAIYNRTFNVEKMDNLVYYNNILTLEEAFKNQAIINIQHQPEIFLENFIQNFKTFNLDINSVNIKFFQAIQEPDNSIKFKTWIKSGNPQHYHSPKATRIFKDFIFLLQIFGLLGLIVAIFRKNVVMIACATLYFCFCFAHCITYMDLMYYYIKIPFLILFTGYFVSFLNCPPFASTKFRDIIFVPLAFMINIAFLTLVILQNTLIFL